MPLPTAARDYLLRGLEATPVVLTALLRDRSDEDAIWDVRPDPNRFTLREALAHMADWDPIWVERVHVVLTEDNPVLNSIDEGVLEVERKYSEIPPSVSLARLRSGRVKLMESLRAVGDDAWDRPCNREFVGDLTLQQLVCLMLGHDAYHLRQAADWIG